MYHNEIIGCDQTLMLVISELVHETLGCGQGHNFPCFFPVMIHRILECGNEGIKRIRASLRSTSALSAWQR